MADKVSEASAAIIRQGDFFMQIFTVLLLAVGLSMDAFAVAICKGLSLREMKWHHAVICGCYFGGFQALMPLIGYYIGLLFAKIDWIDKASAWIAFGLLAVIGANMIRESFSKETEECDASFSPKAMLPMAVATSIDALAAGVAMYMDSVGDTGRQLNIFVQVLMIGVTTFLFSFVGVKVGNRFGRKYKSSAEFVGGCILILLGVKALLEGLGIVKFDLGEMLKSIFNL